jgi:hypothetical protein
METCGDSTRKKYLESPHVSPNVGERCFAPLV